jgi:hypothetical protein
MAFAEIGKHLTIINKTQKLIMPKLIIQKLHNIGPWSVGIIIHDTVGAQLA